MALYTVVSADRVTFDLMHEGTKQGSLKYTNWFSLKAVGMLTDKNGSLYIGPEGFWGTTIVMRRVANRLLTFKMDWSGNVVIDTNFEQVKDSFKFRRSTPLSSSFILVDEKDKELLSVKPDLNWTKFGSDYHISTSEEFESLGYKELMLIALIHVTNYYISTTSSAT